MRVVACLVVAAVLAAGCVTNDDSDAPAVRADFVDPIVDQHDHTDPALHAFATPSMEQLAFNVLNPEGTPYSYIGEMDHYNGLVVVQVLGRGSTPGFVVIDVADVTRPVVIGRAELPQAYVVDVKFSADGSHVLVGTQGRPQATADFLVDPEQAAASAGIAVFNMEDPTAPRFVSVTAVPRGPSTAPAPVGAPGGGCHMLATEVIAAREYVFCVAQTVVVFEFAADPTGTYRLTPVTQYVASPDGGAVAAVTDEETRPRSGANLLPHDVTVTHDPLDGRPLAFVSYWDFGLRVLDVSDPRNPAEIGRWAGAGAQRYEGNVHGAMPFVVDGERFIVVGPELTGQTVPAVWLLDASDYGTLSLADEWLPPGRHVSNGLLLTTHQLQVVAGRIYMTYNHAGVWVLDAATLLASDYADDPTRPEVLGYFLPHAGVTPFDPDVAAVPNTWDLNVVAGAIFATDRYTGFYVLHYKPDTLGDASLTGFG